MSFPLSFLLIPYFIIIFGFLIFSVLHIFHMLRYGATTKVGFLFTFLFVAGTIMIGFISWQALLGVDWQTQINFSSLTNGSVNDLPQF